jgi:hypothetical protein
MNPFSRNSSVDSNDNLLTNTQALAENERNATLEILRALAEIERRRAYIRLGFPSLWEYTTKGLQFSESTAFIRISAMRALKALPELEDKIRSGALSISTISRIYGVIKAEREQGHRLAPESEQWALFARCENKSGKQVTEILIAFSPLALRVQKERMITQNRTELSFIVEPALLEKIKRVRDLSVAKLRSPSSYPELLELMSETTLDEIDPLRKPDRDPRNVKSAPESRSVSPALRARIWRRYDGKCAYVVPEIGMRCESTFGLEIEHCKPHAMGGSSNDPENLMLLCKKHNQWQAIQAYGLEKMSRYLD